MSQFRGDRECSVSFVAVLEFHKDEDRDQNNSSDGNISGGSSKFADNYRIKYSHPETPSPASFVCEYTSEHGANAYTDAKRADYDALIHRSLCQLNSISDDC